MRDSYSCDAGQVLQVKTIASTRLLAKSPSEWLLPSTPGRREVGRSRPEGKARPIAATAATRQQSQHEHE